MNLETILGRLSGVRKTGIGYSAHCPVPGHNDQHSSLSIKEVDGKILLHCFAGCKLEEICEAIHIEVADLFLEEGRGTAQPSQQFTTATVTLASYAEAKKLPIDFLLSLGLSNMNYLGRPAVRIPYTDEDGRELAVRFRTAIEKSTDNDNRFRWRKGSKPCLYGIWRKRISDYIVLCFAAGTGGGHYLATCSLT